MGRLARSNGPAGVPKGVPKTVQIAVGGALGAALRLAVGGSLLLAATSPGPLRLLAVNVGGAALLGLLLARVRDAPPTEHLARWTPLLATGLLGGLTTFSAMIVQAGALGHQAGLLVPDSARMRPAGVALAAGYLLVSVTAGLLAFIAGRDLGRPRAARPRA